MNIVNLPDKGPRDNTKTTNQIIIFKGTTKENRNAIRINKEIVVISAPGIL